MREFLKTFGVRSLLILSIILTVVSAVITYLNVLQKKESTGLVIHAYKVIQASTKLLSLLKDMETGHHGFLITGDSTFLEPYNEARANIDLEIDTLVGLVHDERQEALLNQKLIPLVNRKRAHFEASLAIQRKFGSDSASHFTGMRIVKERMDSIRSTTVDFIDFEQSLLRDRVASLEERYFVNDVIRFSSFALIGITSLAALITIFNKERDNKRLLVALQKFNQQLEEKVKERTHELEVANRDLVRLNEEKTHFLSIATHDLKTPLTGIARLLSLMRMEKESLTDKDLQYLQLMSETCDNMQVLITDLLDLSRIEQGTISLNYQELDVSGIMKALEERFHPWALKKKINLSFLNKSDIGKITTDREMLHRILDNIVSNAIKFSPFGKKVTVSFRQDDSKYCFDIEDEGPGIRPDEYNKLFKRFQKLSARPTDGENSSGLGLSIAKELSNMLKGTIEAESDGGKGTRFSVRLPAQ